MKTTLCVEYIGESQDAKLALFCGIIDNSFNGLSRHIVGNSRPRKPWVAEITGIDKKYGLSRTFLPSKTQRTRSNSTGSRGVELWFIVESGKFYEIKSPQSWKSSDRYFFTIDENGDMIRITKDEVIEWVKKL